MLSALCQLTTTLYLPFIKSAIVYMPPTAKEPATTIQILHPATVDKRFQFCPIDEDSKSRCSIDGRLESSSEWLQPQKESLPFIKAGCYTLPGWLGLIDNVGSSQNRSSLISAFTHGYQWNRIFTNFTHSKTFCKHFFQPPCILSSKISIFLTLAILRNSVLQWSRLIGNLDFCGVTVMEAFK